MPEFAVGIDLLAVIFVETPVETPVEILKPG
jgi:hypothetical protein